MKHENNEFSPADWFFGAMLSLGTDQQFEYSQYVKQAWFQVQYHKNLFECFTHLVNNGVEFNLLTCMEWMRDNNKFTTDFNIQKLSNLTSNVGYPNHNTILSAIEEIAQGYFKNESHRFGNKIMTHVNSNGFSIDEIRSEVDSFQKKIDADYIQEHDKNNVDVVNEILVSHDKVKDGGSIGIGIGFESLKHIELEPVDMMVIAARPAMGKTAFIISSIYNLVFKQKKTIILFSLEMSKVQIIRRLISVATDIASNKIKRGKCSDEELELICRFREQGELENLILFEGSHKASEIIRKCSIESKKRNIELIYIDYLQKISPEKSDLSPKDHVSKVSNQMKQMCVNLQIPTVALAQLSRSVETRGGDKVPIISDLRESGEIEQDASIVAFLHRPEYYGINEDENGDSTAGIGNFIVAKNRDGGIGTTKMRFDSEKMKWSDYNNTIQITSESISSMMLPHRNMPMNFDFDSQNNSPF